ncbi:hypothetical protein AVP42_01700 [Agromyces sp. NDB4Y10]|uniref:acyl-CoA carboxylase epsilon subunit n=1 Tax=Agromyces sp. NDB4Y10 TaxID=1775951 RepID=UPI0007B29C85|nr:acyl-CoA carboxylase epsilon subunit [Agromyces sp. NDB4Y10]KZE93693.1 hypothetical protein AVP42_01700 [Agromyces sp. NDB4Y10]
MTTAPGEPDGAQSIDLRFLTRDVSAEEAAAVTAVLVAAVDEEQASPPPPARSDWAHPRNALRPPIEVGPGRWTSSLR